MIDIWMIFTMTYPFTVILLHGTLEVEFFSLFNFYNIYVYMQVVKTKRNLLSAKKLNRDVCIFIRKDLIGYSAELFNLLLVYSG